jgi:hypothetical protein
MAPPISRTPGTNPSSTLQPIGGATDLNKLLGLPGAKPKLPVFGSQKPAEQTGRIKVEVKKTGADQAGRSGTIKDTNRGANSINTTIKVNQPSAGDPKGTRPSASLGVVVPTPLQNVKLTADMNLQTRKVIPGVSVTIGNEKVVQAGITATTDGKKPTINIELSQKDFAFKPYVNVTPGEGKFGVNFSANW